MIEMYWRGKEFYNTGTEVGWVVSAGDAQKKPSLVRETGSKQFFWKMRIVSCNNHKEIEFVLGLDF
jgi:hypothetical protein